MDPRVGTDPKLVKRHMAEFDAQLQKAVAIFEKAWNARTEPVDDKVFLLRLVHILGFFLQKFLTIHPYANGNGHIGRLIVWILLGRFGFWPNKWPLDASPSYYQALTDHRNGKVKPLNDFILDCIVG
jgi:Fic family protein